MAHNKAYATVMLNHVAAKIAAFLCSGSAAAVLPLDNDFNQFRFLHFTSCVLCFLHIFCTVKCFDCGFVRLAEHNVRIRDISSSRKLMHLSPDVSTLTPPSSTMLQPP